MVAVLALIGLCADLTAFSSKVIITAEDPINPTDPFSTRFKVVNLGNFAVRNVKIDTQFDATFGNNTFTNVKSRASQDVIPILRPGQSMGEWTRIVFEAQPRGDDVVDLTISIEFNPSFAWWKQRFQQRFTTLRNPSGQFRWIEQPLKQ